jgi:Na+:H+ antiporter
MDIAASPALHGDPIAPVILGVTSILLFAIIGRVVARRLHQPTVLGELIMGVLLGNLAWYFGVDLIAILREGPLVFEVVNMTLSGTPLEAAAIEIFGPDKGAEMARIMTGPHGGEVMQVAHAVDVFSRYGVIFLLFMAGIETELDELRRVGTDSIRVALIGVVLPFGLGLAAALLLRPDLPFNSGLFIAATLCATSVGISAEVLRETGYSRRREGHIVLGAAVADDILGLIILAVVTGLIVSGSVHVFDVLSVITISLLFLVAAVTLGPTLVRLAALIMRRLDIVEAKMFTSYLFVMILAWIANLAGLATIVGAFAAGVVLSDSHFNRHEAGDDGAVTIRELIMPLEVILVPIFFILMGIQVKLEAFASWPVLTVASGLLIAAIVGKLASGLGAGKPSNRLIVAIGMLPRGEVGLVFAAIGRALGVLDDAMFSAIVLMVIVTTLLAPPWLKRVIRRRAEAEARA